MKKIVLVPDSFKGTMSSGEICKIMERAVRFVYPEAEVVSVPVADGGEGSVDAFLAALGGHRVEVPCSGPEGQAIMGFYGLLPDGTAVIEMAAAAGLPQVSEPRNPEKTTTYGVGQLMRHAAEHGAGKLILCLGGSGTNDGGCGAAAACGVGFYNGAGEVFVPTGGTLAAIAHIDCSGLDAALREIPIVTMCDIDNPLCGQAGAAAVFGPQKGADDAMVVRLDLGLAHLAEVVRQDLGKEILHLSGAGAAGGMGAGMVAFFDSVLQPGIETILDAVAFEAILRQADLVLTGEGKLDTQSLHGKVVAGVARRAKRCGVPVAAIVGDVGDGIELIYGLGVTGIFSINRVAVPYQQARLRAKEDLYGTVENLMRFQQAFEN